MKTNLLKITSITSCVTAIVLAGAIVFSNSNISRFPLVSRASDVNGSLSYSYTSGYYSKIGGSLYNYAFSSTTPSGSNVYLCSFNNYPPSSYALVASFGSSSYSSAYLSFYSDANGTTPFKFQNISSIVITTHKSSSESNVGFRIYTESTDGITYTDTNPYYGTISASKTVTIDDISGARFLKLVPTSSSFLDIKSITINYSCSTSYVDPDDKEVSSISISTAPTKIVYYEGETFDPAGLEIEVTWDDDSSSDISYDSHSSDFSFSPSLSTLLTTSNTSVSIIYGGHNCNQSITVNVVVLSSIAVTTAPTKTTYSEGENFDSTGMVVTATYNNGSTANVTSNCTFSPSASLVAGTTSVTVSYTEGGVTKTTTQEIQVTAGSFNIRTALIGNTYSLIGASGSYNYSEITFNDGTGTFYNWYNSDKKNDGKTTQTFTWSIDTSTNILTFDSICDVSISSIQSRRLSSSYSMTVSEMNQTISGLSVSLVFYFGIGTLRTVVFTYNA